LDPDTPEDVADLETLLSPVETRIAEKKPGRNDPCHCGSGKKYKKCCG
jgi:SWIM/SEC-C metal-binding protein